MVPEGACQVAEDKGPGEAEWTVTITYQASGIKHLLHTRQFICIAFGHLRDFFFFLKEYTFILEIWRRKKTIDNAKEKHKRPITPSTEITTVNISFDLSHSIDKNAIIGVQSSSYFVSIYYMI